MDLEQAVKGFKDTNRNEASTWAYRQTALNRLELMFFARGQFIPAMGKAQNCV